MELSEFVETALIEILDGIRAAQKKEGGSNIAAALSLTDGKSQLIHDSNLGTFTVVDFDVSVVAETKVGGKGGIKVWSVGVEGEGGHSRQQTSKVKFSVPVRLPEGDRSKQEEIDRKVRDANARLEAENDAYNNGPHGWMTR